MYWEWNPRHIQKKMGVIVPDIGNSHRGWRRFREQPYLTNWSRRLDATKLVCNSNDKIIGNRVHCYSTQNSLQPEIRLWSDGQIFGTGWNCILLGTGTWSLQDQAGFGKKIVKIRTHHSILTCGRMGPWNETEKEWKHLFHFVASNFRSSYVSSIKHNIGVCAGGKLFPCRAIPITYEVLAWWKWNARPWVSLRAKLEALHVEVFSY